MHVVSHPEANQEMEAAALWYEERQPNLGNDSLDEFEYTLRRIVGLAINVSWGLTRGGDDRILPACDS